MKKNYFKKLVTSTMMLLTMTLGFTSCEGTLDDIFGEWSRPVNSKPTEDPMLSTPLTLEAVNSSETFKLTFSSTLPEATTIEYSANGGSTWSTITVPAGTPGYATGSSWTWVPQVDGTESISGLSKVMLRATNEAYGKLVTGLGGFWDPIGNINIQLDKDCYIYGNVMSLIDKDNFSTLKSFTKDYAFTYLFSGNSHLKNHGTNNLLLPATTLKIGSYMNMFSSCSGLTKAPELPATGLTESCYRGMFDGCTGLTAAPELPATTLQKYCYENMYYGCTSLTAAPELPATTLADYCYTRMFYGCTSLTTPPTFPSTAPTLGEGSYYAMFADCTALTASPVIRATVLTDQCCGEMFRGCTNLATITCLATDISATDCTNQWVDGVKAGGTFYKNASMTTWAVGANGIPDTTPAWTVADF